LSVEVAWIPDETEIGVQACQNTRTVPRVGKGKGGICFMMGYEESDHTIGVMGTIAHAN
jgi:hypothetical protein